MAYNWRFSGVVSSRVVDFLHQLEILKCHQSHNYSLVGSESLISLWTYVWAARHYHGQSRLSLQYLWFWWFLFAEIGRVVWFNFRKSFSLSDLLELSCHHQKVKARSASTWSQFEFRCFHSKSCQIPELSQQGHELFPLCICNQSQTESFSLIKHYPLLIVFIFELFP